jgi:hypothetical protein
MKLSSLFLLVCAAFVAAAEPRKPNIVFILSDDLAQGDIGCYGQKLIRTPNLDRMAKEGTRFTQGYCGTTVCAPSRTSLMVGQHTGRSPDPAGERLCHGVHGQVGHGDVRHHRQPAEERLRPLLRL